MSAPSITKKLAFPIFGIGLSAISAHLGGPEAGAIVGSIATALNWFGGVFGNRTDALWSQPTEPDAAEVFRNHDLRVLIRRTMLRLIENVAISRREGHGKITDTLQECASPLADAFMAELDDPSSPLHEIVIEGDIPDFLTAFAKKEGDVEVLTDAQCHAFLDRHPLPVSDEDQELWQTERNLLAVALRCDFGTSLWNLTKIDSTTDGKAFAAVQMLYLSRILDAVEGPADAPNTSVLEQHLDHLIQRLDEKQARWFQRLWRQVERHHEVGTASHQKTHRLLLLLLKRLDAVSMLTDHIASAEQRFGNIESQLAAALAAQPRIESPEAMTRAQALERELNEISQKHGKAAKCAAEELINNLRSQLTKIGQLAGGESTFVAFKDDPVLQEEIFPEMEGLLRKFCKAAPAFVRRPSSTTLQTVD